MISNETQKQLIEDIKILKEEIKKIYYIRQFEIAKEFENRILEIEQELLNFTDNENNIGINYDLQLIIRKDSKIRI